MPYQIAAKTACGAAVGEVQFPRRSLLYLEAIMAATTAPGIVRVCRTDSEVTVQVEGWGRMNHGLPLRRLAEQAVAAGVTRFHVDLRQCTYLDSTFLGTLLYLKRILQKKNGQLTLVSPSAECWRLFKQIGIDDAFAVEAALGTCGPWTELPGGRDDPHAVNQAVYQAHEERANLGGPAGDAFAAVARCMSREMDKSKG